MAQGESSQQQGPLPAVARLFSVIVRQARSDEVRE